MNKADLIETVAHDLEISKAAAERTVNTVLENIKNGVRKEKVVQLIGFGTFTFKQRKARTGRNPQTGETIRIKPSKSVAFRPGKQFKDML